MPSQASTKLGNVMIMQNSCAGTHLLHVLKRLSIFLCYLVILSNIQWMKHPTCLSWIFTANIVQQISATFQIYSGIYFQKYSLNQTSHHQHFQHSSIPYTEVITWLIYGSPLLVQIQFMADKLSAPQSVIELSMCSCKKTNCDSLRCNMCQCLNCSNIEFDKSEFEWGITI